jgi:hypothetical protein
MKAIKLVKVSKLMMGAVAALLVQTSAHATSINVDQILAPGDVNAAQLSGTVDMTLSGSVLTITLRNTSANAAGSGAGVLLTGIGFTLPGSYAIGSGSANMGTSTAVGFTKPGDGDVSEEWGYDNEPLNSGALLNAAQPVDTAVSSMESQSTTQFQAGSLGDPVNLDGPDFGLASATETDGFGLGVEAIRDRLVITLNLTGSFGGNLINAINSAWVVLTFGSPGDSTTTVPDASSSVALLGMALMGVEALRRRYVR